MLSGCQAIIVCDRVICTLVLKYKALIGALEEFLSLNTNSAVIDCATLPAIGWGKNYTIKYY